MSVDVKHKIHSATSCIRTIINKGGEVDFKNSKQKYAKMDKSGWASSFIPEPLWLSKATVKNGTG
jgi:hypothetical protein